VPVSWRAVQRAGQLGPVFALLAQPSAGAVGFLPPNSAATCFLGLM
jgi:hypothetical protein